VERFEPTHGHMWPQSREAGTGIVLTIALVFGAPKCRIVCRVSAMHSCRSSVTPELTATNLLLAKGQSSRLE
jgi:hypothetical protein